MTSKIETYYFKANQGIPNHPTLPVLFYPSAMTSKSSAEVIDILAQHDWSNAWVDGILDQHHFHDNTHEVLMIQAGQANVQIGGPEGMSLQAKQGDVFVLPAGIGHKRLQASKDFKVIGAYPGGSDYKMCYPTEPIAEATFEQIKKVALPGQDPVFGPEGPLLEYWH
ncbi:cupin domain-containing protein [Ignavigranum ruoffiae]|uniref:Uncharacterized protein YjlB n=1 Tax=Ignavigranum ruoffiae TaxID=89093 RepID=A0A1H9EYD4_9LACT|nr:cupin domain-containing protein [Ignavigranum ruoffiae]SEQ30720.1 Uncharacterized protein YjlB [Ignavigranum ruoffiae]